MNDVIDNDTGEAHEIVPAEMSGAIAAESANRWRPPRSIRGALTR